MTSRSAATSVSAAASQSLQVPIALVARRRASERCVRSSEMVADKVLIASAGFSQVAYEKIGHCYPITGERLPPRYVSSDVGRGQKASAKCRRVRHLSTGVSTYSTGTLLSHTPQWSNRRRIKHFGMEAALHSFGNP